jgi:hypothetical protein
MLRHHFRSGTPRGKSAEDIGRWKDAAEKDLRLFLSPSMWNKLWPDTVREMIDHAVTGATRVASVIDAYRAAPQDDKPDEECENGPRC